LLTYSDFRTQIHGINDHSFTDIALRVFRYQAQFNPVYQRYLAYRKVNYQSVKQLSDIPFLPITFFKSHRLATGNWPPAGYFESSGTTGRMSSLHYFPDHAFYAAHTRQNFEWFFGPVGQYHFFALLPSYLERGHSSLVTMLHAFIRQSGSPYSGFYLHDTDAMLQQMEEARRKDGRKVMLWGVTFALLDLAEKHAPRLGDCVVLETGGMKGRREEITREALHAQLTQAFGVERIYSEYGMTELFSQAYTRGGTRFYTPPWMKVLVRDLYDPFAVGLTGKTGGINIIDLGNVHSVAFIETADLGRAYADGSFEVLGRIDNSEVRGCNLLVE
jgi:phenylacetate-coenzyme A ligase PaaK-like adenylate-forming protein